MVLSGVSILCEAIFTPVILYISIVSPSAFCTRILFPFTTLTRISSVSLITAHLAAEDASNFEGTAVVIAHRNIRSNAFFIACMFSAKIGYSFETCKCDDTNMPYLTHFQCWDMLFTWICKPTLCLEVMKSA